MKASIISALLFGAVASAVVLPPYQLEKRDADDVVVTVTSTTTIYLDPTAASAFFASQSSAEKSSTSPSTSPTSTASTPPAPPPTSTPPPAPTSPPVQAAAAVPTTPPAAPVNTYVPPPPAPTPPAAPAAPAPAPAAPAAPASGGIVSGTGDITFYELAAGLTSCGGSHQDSEAVVALPIGVMEQYDGANPNNNPLCGKSIAITYQGKTQYGTVVDSCGGCDSQSIDLSPSLFQSLTGNMGLGRVGGVSWSVS